jgi:hypothetical protein
MSKYGVYMILVDVNCIKNRLLNELFDIVMLLKY